MEKEKRVKGKDFEFNPDDYDYMDSLILVGWVWEFIRRNKKYRELHMKIQQRTKKQMEGLPVEDDQEVWNEYMKHFYPFGPVPPDWGPPNKKKPKEEPYSYSPWIDRLKGVKLVPFEVVNLKWALAFNKIGEQCAIPHPLISKTHAPETPKDLTGKTKEGINVFYSVTYPPREKDYPDNYSQYQHPIEILFKRQGEEKFVMVMVDLSASGSIDDLLKGIKSQLADWRKAIKLPKTKSAKTTKKNKNLLIKRGKIWKSYLMVFDLVEAGCSYNDASDILSKYDEFYLEPKNIENHYHGALALIEEGYKKFI